MKFQTVKFKSLNSTNTEAINMIRKDKISPTIIITENQTKGKGRYGRKWISLKGNLFLSIYFKIRKNLSVKKITKKNCIIIKKSLSTFLKPKIMIKQPNDLLINGKKFCGILQETVIHKGNKFLIIGVGINLFKSPNIPNYPATFLSKYSKKRINKSLIFNAIKKMYENR